MPSATHARTWRTAVGRRRSRHPGSLVRGTVRISTSKSVLFWGPPAQKGAPSYKVVVEGDDIKVEV
jgi:hypothetical protein